MELLYTGLMWFSKCLNDIVDSSRIFYRIGGKSYDHIRCLTCSMDMNITESEYRLKYPCGMCIHFLNTIERALRYSTRKCWYLINTDNPGLCDDKEIEFIIDPTEEDESQEYNPIEWESSPIESASKEFDNRSLVLDKYCRRNKKCNEVEEMEYEDDPVTMKCEDYFFVFSQERDMLFFDHVIWGSLR